MAKVTVHRPETPSESIITSATAPDSISDSDGRTIGVKRLLPLDRLRLFEVVGPENSKNEAYLGYASLAFHVSSIDGDAISRPTNKMQLEALVQQLGDSGLDAVGAYLQQIFKADQSNTRDEIKNG